MRRIYVSRLPSAEYLALELAPPLRLDHLTCLCWTVEAGFAGETRSEGRAAWSLLAGRGTAGSTAAAEDGEEGVICEGLVRGMRRAAEGCGGHCGRTLLLRARGEASQARPARCDGRPEG